MATFGSVVKKIRKERKLSLKEVAKNGGISHSYLSQIENEKRNAPKPDMLSKLAKGLGIDYYQLLHLAGYVNKEQYEEYEKLEREAIDLIFQQKQAEKERQKVKQQLEEIKDNEYKQMSSQGNDFFMEFEEVHEDGTKANANYFDLYRLLHSQTDTMYKFHHFSEKDKQNIIKFIETFIIDSK